MCVFVGKPGLYGQHFGICMCLCVRKRERYRQRVSFRSLCGESPKSFTSFTCFLLLGHAVRYLFYHVYLFPALYRWMVLHLLPPSNMTHISWLFFIQANRWPTHRNTDIFKRVYNKYETLYRGSWEGVVEWLKDLLYDHEARGSSLNLSGCRFFLFFFEGEASWKSCVSESAQT